MPKIVIKYLAKSAGIMLYIMAKIRANIHTWKLINVKKKPKRIKTTAICNV
jgi:hypothetical protein